MKRLVALGLVLVVLAIGGGVVWWVSVPHSAAEQFAVAEKKEGAVRAAAATKAFQDYEKEFDEVIKEYEKVEGVWGKASTAAASGAGPATSAPAGGAAPAATPDVPQVEAWRRIAKLQEELAKDRAKAIEAYDHLVKDYPSEDAAGAALLEQARLVRQQAEELKIGKPQESSDKYKLALDKLEDYRKKFAAGKKLDAAWMETGRIWQEGIGDPLIHAIEAFDKVVKEFPGSEYRPEALYRLGQLMEKAHDNEKALAVYGELLEKYPTNRPWAERAQLARGKLLAEKMDKQEEAAQAFKDLQEKFPDSPLRDEARSGEKNARAKEADQQSEDYGKGRYGRMPVDTLSDKAIPPAEMFRKFAEQKLDADQYDLKINFTPAEHRMAVNGSLKLVNRGGDKKDLLLMLTPGMKITSTKIDGAEVESEQLNETLVLHLATPLKKDAPATLEFAYSGQFAAPQPGEIEIGAPKRAATRPAGRGEGAGAGPATTQAGAATQGTGESAGGAAGGRGEMAGGSPSGPMPEAGPRLTMNPQLMLGEFGYGLSGGAWYPVTIIGDVFNARLDFTITTGQGYEVVGNGAVVSREPARGHFVFETKRPVFGLYFCYGKYTVQEKLVGKIQYYTYLRPANASKSDAYVAAASNILDYYSERFGAFPYEKFALIEAPLPPFLGGVGPASLMILHEGMVAQHDPPTTLLAHELAHQWFGNLVPINMIDPGYSQWLSEGFATYADALYTEKTEGPEALARHMDRYAQLYFQVTLNFPKSQVVSIKNCLPGSAQYRPVVYEKGAMVLQGLRKVMGDEKFFALMRKYVETYQDKPSVVNDFRHLADEVMGEDLSWFFAQWLDQTVYAHWVIKAVDIKPGPVAVKSPGGAPSTVAGAHVIVHVEQPDDLIRMPVDVTFFGPEGKRAVLPAKMEKFEENLEFDVPFVPVKVVMDEANWVLKSPRQDHIWPAESVEKPEAAK